VMRRNRAEEAFSAKKGGMVGGTKKKIVEEKESRDAKGTEGHSRSDKGGVGGSIFVRYK